METKLAHRCQICSAICHSSVFYVALAGDMKKLLRLTINYIIWKCNILKAHLPLSVFSKKVTLIHYLNLWYPRPLPRIIKNNLPHCALLAGC